MAAPVRNYVDYEVACKSFDTGRTATGVEEMVAMMSGLTGKDISKVRILDAGCGTGSYSKAFLEKGVGHVTLLDASNGMLSIASSKLSEEIKNGRADIVHHGLPSLPFQENSFDVVTLIHVIHQLDSQPSEGTTSFPNLSKCVQEAYRVLRPNGIILIDMLSQEQAANSSWFYCLMPRAVDKFRRKFMPVPELLQLYRECGFRKNTLVYRPGQTANLKEELFLNLEGPLDEEWRKGCSFWNVVDDKELASALHTIRELKSTGRLQAFFSENDKFRQNFGQDVQVIGKK